LLDKQAEELKVQYGSALREKSQEDFIISIEGLKGREPKEFSLKDLCLIIQARMEEIIHAVMFQIENSKFQGELNSGIVITGGGSLVKNLKQLVSFISGYDVRIAYPSKYVTGVFADKINKPQYSTAVGLIMKGYEFNKIEQERILEQLNKKQEELLLQREKENQELNQSIELENEKKHKEKKESKFFEIFKKRVTNLFDEDDEFEK